MSLPPSRLTSVSGSRRWTVAREPSRCSLSGEGAGMKVSEAVRSRLSVRAFLDKPVPLDVLRGILELAARAPSGGNLQPWRLHVLSGGALEKFREVMRQRLARAPSPDPIEYHVYPANLWEPYRTQ